MYKYTLSKITKIFDNFEVDNIMHVHVHVHVLGRQKQLKCNPNAAIYILMKTRNHATVSKYEKIFN